MEFTTQSYENIQIIIDQLSSVSKSERDDNNYKFLINFSYKNNADNYTIYYDNKYKRDYDFITIDNLRKSNIITKLKNYFKKYEEIIIGTVVIILIDQIIFKGKLRERVCTIFETLIDKVSKKIEGD